MILTAKILGENQQQTNVTYPISIALVNYTPFIVKGWMGNNTCFQQLKDAFELLPSVGVLMTDIK